MKRKIGIGLLIILNLTFMYVIIMGAVLYFGLIVAPLGHQRGLEVANQTTIDILMMLTVVSIIVFSINYFLIKKVINMKKSFLTSLITTGVGIIVFTPFFISAKQSFLNHQNGTTTLQQFINRQTITEVQLITNSDTIRIAQLDEFLTDIGLAKCKRGPWKYAKKMKLIFQRIDGSEDSIFTNGQIFGAYKGKYFSTDQNVITQYLENKK